MALIWVCAMNSVYLARNKAMKVSILLETQREQAKEQALLDTGTMENFLHLRTVEWLQLETHKLEKPQQVKNMDGTLNRVGDVT
jgi:hypothetical protein